jgi:hypothetical protein
MTLFSGVDFVLLGPQDSMDQASEAQLGQEGELVLVRQQAATSGYIRHGDAYRNSGDPPTRHKTGDIFKAVAVTGEGDKRRVWIQHCCRQDDLLVHTSGEMTNPVPVELALASVIAALKGSSNLADQQHLGNIGKMVLLGQNRPR